MEHIQHIDKKNIQLLTSLGYFTQQVPLSSLPTPIRIPTKNANATPSSPKPKPKKTIIPSIPSITVTAPKSTNTITLTPAPVAMQQPPSTTTPHHVYTRDQLKAMTVKNLKKLPLAKGGSGLNKDPLIDYILSKQS